MFPISMTRLPRRWLSALALVLMLLVALTGLASGSPTAPRTLIPIGGDYDAATLQRFAQAAAQVDTTGRVYLLVLPIAYGTDPYYMSNGARNTNLTLADSRRAQIERACQAVKRATQTCTAVLAPILVRSDAYLQSNLDLFTADLDGIYILGGDQDVAMEVVANTPTEQRMAAAYAAGVVVSGNSAGDAVQSYNMIGGYTGSNGPENGLQQGSVDLWTGPADSAHRGLIFGLSNAILEQHTFQRGRIGRMLNAAWSTGLTGIGVDVANAAAIQNETSLTDVVGPTSTIIADFKTYGATGRYAGPARTLAVHHVATHLIPQGDYAYDLAKMRPLVRGIPQPAPDLTGRTWPVPKLPAGYGALLLGGDIRTDPSGPAAQRFVQVSGGANARLVVLAAGYSKNADAQADAKSLAASLQMQVTSPVAWFVIDSHADLTSIQNALGTATGVLITAPDQSTVVSALSPVAGMLNQVWQKGTALFADNAAAAAMGPFLATDPTATSATREEDAIADFRAGGVTVSPGLGFVNGISVEPRLLVDYRWGRLYNESYQHPRTLALGVDAGTAVEVTANGLYARGRSAVIALDGNYAAFAIGANGGLGAQYVLLDTYVDGDAIVP